MHLRKSLKFNSGCTGWQSTPKICWKSIYQTLLHDFRQSKAKNKNYFNVKKSYLKASFKQKPKSTTKQRRTAKISWIWFCVHCLEVHTPKSIRDQFTKLCWMTSAAKRKNVLTLLFLSYSWYAQYFKTRENWKNTLNLILGALADIERPKIC